MDLSLIDSSKVINMNSLFNNCENLQDLNIPYFNTEKVQDITSIFDGCSKLEILNINSFVQNNYIDFSDLFKDISKELVYCLKEKSENQEIINILQNKNAINNCTFICKNRNEKIISENYMCIVECSQNNNYRYEYNNICFNKCPNGTKSSLNNQNLCIEYEEISISTLITNISTTVFDTTTYFSPINDIITTIIKENIPLTNEAIIGDSLSNIQKDLDIETSSIISNEICSSKDFLQKKCENIKYISLEQTQNMINQIKKDITNRNLKDLLENVTNEEKTDLIVEEYNTIYQITSSYNQNNKKYYNISTIKLGECENKLKKKINISELESLLIFKIDIYEEGLLMPIVEYEIYHPYTLEKLNLDICFENKMEISVPVININEGELYKYDMKSVYYNDKCFPSSNDNKVDLIISDRQNQYINNNLTLCENNCELSEYDNETKKAICKCIIKNETDIKSDIIIDKEKLLSQFFKIKSLVNLDIMKCYKALFTKSGIMKNIGSYIIISIISIYIILFFIFITKGFSFLQIQISYIIKAKETFLKANKIKNNNSAQNKNSLKISKKDKKIITSIPNIKKIKIKKIKTTKNTKNEPPSKKNGINKKNDYSNTNKFSSQDNLNKIPAINNSVKILIYKRKNAENKNKEVNLYFNLNDYELNSLSYNEAIKYDKRSYCKYYTSLIRTKHLIFFSFWPNKDYNSKAIKICLFLFSFALYFTVNCLFFSDSTIHEIYEESGSFNFIYHLPQIIYSTLISSVINISMKLLSLSQSDILKIKRRNKLDSQHKIKSVLKRLKIKFTIFFILSFLFLILFWYYLSCFCAIYKNTQIILVEDTLISFLLSLVYPFGIYFLPGIFRIPSLKDAKNNRICLYEISKIIQLI